MAQELFLLLRGVVDIQEHLVLVLQVPLVVLLDVGDEVRVYVAQEVRPVLMRPRGVVRELVAWYDALTLYY